MKSLVALSGGEIQPPAVEARLAKDTLPPLKTVVGEQLKEPIDQASIAARDTYHSWQRSQSIAAINEANKPTFLIPQPIPHALPIESAHVHQATGNRSRLLPIAPAPVAWPSEPPRQLWPTSEVNTSFGLTNAGSLSPPTAQPVHTDDQPSFRQADGEASRQPKIGRQVIPATRDSTSAEHSSMGTSSRLRESLPFTVNQSSAATCTQVSHWPRRLGMAVS